MTHEVAKPFNTFNRRLTVGLPVSEADDLSPFTFSERLENKFLKATTADPAPEPARAPRKAAAPEDTNDPK